MKISDIDSNVQLFLTDYASYNRGTQFEFGHWVDLSDFVDAEDFMNYVKKHLKECDEKSPIDGLREEPMFTDHCNLPDFLYSESLSIDDIEKIYKYIAVAKYLENASDEKIIGVNNTISINQSLEDEIYFNNETFFNETFVNNYELVRKIFYGNYNYSDKYLKYNGSGNFESFDDLDDEISLEPMVEYMIENMNAFGIKE